MPRSGVALLAGLLGRHPSVAAIAPQGQLTRAVMAAGADGGPPTPAAVRARYLALAGPPRDGATYLLDR